MGLSLSEFLNLLDAAEAEPWWRRYVLHLTVPVVLRQSGRPRRTVEGVMYSYTRRQVKAMRAVIYESARADMQLIEVDPESPE